MLLPKSSPYRALFCALCAAPLGLTTAFAQTPISTAEAVKSAHWADNVSIEESGATFRYVSDGMPSHGFAAQYVVPIDGNAPPFGDDPEDQFEVVNSADWVVESPIDVTISLKPVYSTTTTATNMGMIGVMISGARMFNDYEDMARSEVALDDNRFSGSAAFVDTCNGHPLQSGAQYHYHGTPPCVTKTVDSGTEHSHMIGVLLDGFPIYGAQGEGGVIVSDTDLDECSGHVEPTPEFPNGIYHYHLTTDAAPYSIDCYHGVVDASLSASAQMPMPDFAAIATSLGVDQHALMDALSTQQPPDFESAAKTLGISVDDLRKAMPPPPNP